MPRKKSIFHTFQSFIRRKTSQQYKFNQQFEKGVWDGLSEIVELGRYSIIAGYVGFYCKNPSVADLGCGEGILQQRLTQLNYSSYLGVDFSDVAIHHAKQYEDNKTSFIVGDLNKLEISGMFDAIIYNESFYYLSNQAEVLKHVVRHLKDDGIIIFSIVDKNGTSQTGLWNIINEVLSLRDSTRVINRLGHSWTIQVYKKDVSKIA